MLHFAAQLADPDPFTTAAMSSRGDNNNNIFFFEVLDVIAEEQQQQQQALRDFFEAFEERRTKEVECGICLLDGYLADLQRISCDDSKSTTDLQADRSAPTNESKDGSLSRTSRRQKQEDLVVDAPSPLPFTARSCVTTSGITKPSIRRLARRGGIKRISSGIYGEVRITLKRYLSKDIVIRLEYQKRKTVTAIDRGDSVEVSDQTAHTRNEEIDVLSEHSLAWLTALLLC
ncbi:hypothetical protein BST61_g11337 [Cercospora zeina]